MKNILVLTDFSDKAKHSAEYALYLAIKLKAKLLLLHVYNGNIPGKDDISVKYEAERKLNNLLTYLKHKRESNFEYDFNVPIESLIIHGTIGNLGLEIKNTVNDKNIWMIVMGTKGDDCISNFIFGTNAFSVINNVDCPIIFIPKEAEIKDIKRIEIATDLSSFKFAGWSFLKPFKEAFDSDIIVRQVVMKSNGELIEQGQSSDYEIFEPTFGDRNVEGLSYKEIRCSAANNEITLFAVDQNIDMLSIIHHKMEFFKKIFHGSTTQLLLKSNKLPLMVFPYSNSKYFEVTNR